MATRNVATTKRQKIPGNKQSEREEVLRANFAEWEAYSAESVKHYAQFAIQSLLYMNGGALVVIMALIGNMFRGPQGEKALEFALHLQFSFDLFVAGMVLCVFAAGVTYFNYTNLVVFWRDLRFAEVCDYRTAPNPFANRLIFWTRLLGIIFVVASCIAFFMGCFASIHALATFQPGPSSINLPN